MSNNPTEIHNNRLAMVAKYTHNAIVITDVNGLVEWVNEGFTRITGYTLEEVKGQKPGQILQGPESDLMTIATIRHALQNEEPFDVELINYSKDGHPYWIRIEGVPLRDADGMLNGFMAIESDISGRKQYEDMLINAKKAAEAASEAKIQFLNNVSHELRTPMNAIIGLSQLLELTDLDEEQLGYVEDILISSERLQSSIENLFVFSHDNFDQSIDIHSPLDLATLIDNIATKYTVRAAAKGLDFIYQPSNELPKFIFGNECLIEQVVNNLCDNALKFTTEGDIRLTVELSGTALERYMMVKIVDTGIGFDQAEIGNLFTPFNQIDTSLTRQYEGLGLGLYASRRIAQVIGGDVELSSAKRYGTTAKFWWPI